MDLEWLSRLEYLGLSPEEARDLRGPFRDRTQADIENPHLFTLRVMRDPLYFYWTVKVLFGIELFAYQCVILREMWIHPFPMLIGSRGLGKSTLLSIYALLRAIFQQGSRIVVCGSGFRQAKTILGYAENIWYKSPLLRSLFAGESRCGPEHHPDRWIIRLGESTITGMPIGDGCLSFDSLVTYFDRFGVVGEHAGEPGYRPISGESIWGCGRWRGVDQAYNNGLKPTKVVRTHMGYAFEGTHNHAMKVVRGGRVEWCRSDEMRVGDRILIDRSWRWHAGDEDVSEAEAYALGLMVGDGSYTTNQRLGFATGDPEDFIKPLSDGVGWDFAAYADGQHWGVYGVDETEAWLSRWEMSPTATLHKTIPLPMLRAPRAAMTAFLQGLFDTDGHVVSSDTKGGTSLSIGFTNTSRRLVEQMHYILLHYGIVAHVGSRDRNEAWNTSHEMLITGPDAERFVERIGFRLRRKREACEAALGRKLRSVAIGDTVPDIRDLMIGISSRNRLKKWSSNRQNDDFCACKIRRRKNITHSYAAGFLEIYGGFDEPDLDVIRALADSNVYYDEIVSIEDGECETFDIHVPDGNEYCANGFFSHNTGIRGERANCILADEFAAQDPEIFEEVISGFGVVSMSPVDQAKARARKRVLQRHNLWSDAAEEAERKRNLSNQVIFSGTATWEWNHFCAYWKKWRDIILSRGDEETLYRVLGSEPEDGFDWRDYCVMRIPYTALPEGYMDDKQVARSKGTMHVGIFLNEFGACFSKDSQGFFKRSLIESCVTKVPITPNRPDAEPVKFLPVLRGRKGPRYVIGVDPASERDNFAIIVLECHADHRRVVFCWTTDKKRYRDRLKKEFTDEKEFYRFVSRKIRDLLEAFPCEDPIIALDMLGGGVGVLEALGNPETGEPILPVNPGHPLHDGKTRDTDHSYGRHIVYVFPVSKADVVAEANHGMRHDLEERVLLFPGRDLPGLAAQILRDETEGRVHDTLEECVDEIEDLKDEMATIQMSRTPQGNRERWDTPDVKTAGKKGRQRKDRYSALLMANHAARRLENAPAEAAWDPHGGFADRILRIRNAEPEPMYLNAPDWFKGAADDQMDHYGWA